MLEGTAEGYSKPGSAAFAAVLVQIFLLDLVFSLDSVLTAIGMADEIVIMVAAVCIAIGVMLVAAEPLSAFVHKHPTVKMLALSFLMLIGVALIADGLEFHIPRGYLYFGVAFATLIEVLNLLARKRHTEKSA
jgi:predicted tellurium resistance membrane protein TerC